MCKNNMYIRNDNIGTKCHFLIVCPELHRSVEQAQPVRVSAFPIFTVFVRHESTKFPKYVAKIS